MARQRKRTSRALRRTDFVRGGIEMTNTTTTQQVNYNDMDDDAFRQMVHDWFVENYPEELRFPPERMHWDECGDWYMTLAKKGWLAPGWPVEHGGMV